MVAVVGNGYGVMGAMVQGRTKERNVSYLLSKTML